MNDIDTVISNSDLENQERFFKTHGNFISFPLSKSHTVQSRFTSTKCVILVLQVRVSGSRVESTWCRSKLGEKAVHGIVMSVLPAITEMTSS